MRPDDFNDERLAKLADFLRATRPEELTCDEWLDRVGAYADAVAAGLEAPAGSELVRQHLALCPECREEFEALVNSLRSH